MVEKKGIYVPEIDIDTCMGCGLCQDSCNSVTSKQCLILKNGVMCVFNEKACKMQQPECDFRCVKLCPTKALSLARIDA
ncbi:hypothetical protein GF325_16790 [Candidatus Bathyarchaeota archaeon]|nr:hypothetical protein [Candidatus Bathyarchaeota archaeon]